jgi:hypothetical protein
MEEHSMPFKTWKDAEVALLARGAFKDRFELWENCAGYLLSSKPGPPADGGRGSMTDFLHHNQLTAILTGAMNRKASDDMLDRLLDMVFSGEREIKDLNDWASQQTQHH